MPFIEQIVETYRQTGFLHHAYLLVGKQKTLRTVLAESLKAIEDETDPIWENYETFGIAESRGLIERSARRNWNGRREFVVLAARRYTAEAQNALLKLFEEPRAGLHFFILGGRPADFLPTLLSRLMVVENKTKNETGSSFPPQFLSAPPALRLDLVARELKKELPREEWLEFLNALEVIYHRVKPLNGRALAEIGLARGYLADPASSPRLLFEHLALVLPSC